MESNGMCQYCHESISYGDNHLDCCNVYKSIMVHLNSSNSSAEELPFTKVLCNYHKENSRITSKPQVFPLRPIKKRIKACPQCKAKYDNSVNLPYLLPACGHTFCKACLAKMSYKSMIRCALCNSMTYKELKKLPVNYALLEAFEGSSKKPRCKEHDSEIMAYCNTEDLLLCGSCTFKHRSHEVYLLTDPKIQLIANCKKNSLKTQEIELCELKNVWEKAREELQEGFKEMKNLVDLHQSEFDSTEEQLISDILQGSNSCVQEINKLVDSEDFISVKRKIKNSLIQISTRLSKIREIKDHYDSLTIVEKLRKSLEPEPVIHDSPPSLSPIVKVMERLKGSVDYESCIKNHHLKIS